VTLREIFIGCEATTSLVDGFRPGDLLIVDVVINIEFIIALIKTTKDNSMVCEVDIVIVGISSIELSRLLLSEIMIGVENFVGLSAHVVKLLIEGYFNFSRSISSISELERERTFKSDFS
jgi:hypothetical protein